MITNTELYYTKMKEFQNKRGELMKVHDKRLNSLESSKDYEEDLKKENDRFEAELKALRDEYRHGLLKVFGGMMDAIGKRSISAPTNDQVNLLNVLKMKKKVTLEECRRTAEAVKDNPIAVSVVTEIAHAHGITQSFDHLCQEMSSQKASEIVTGMKNRLEDFLQCDMTRASKDHRQMKRRLFTNQADFYREEGFDLETLRKFSEIVDV